MLVTFASSLIKARVRHTRVNGHIAIFSSVTRFAEACVIANSRLISAHGTIGARVVITIRFLFLALKSTESLEAIASKKSSKKLDAIIQFLAMTYYL